MSNSKKEPKKGSNGEKKELNPLYFVGIGIVLIVVILLIFLPGYMNPPDNIQPSRGEMDMEMEYFGVLDEESSPGEIEEHVRAFIAQNTGISDACVISHFYNNNCGACQRLEPWLITFKAKYPEIQITSYELHDPASRKVLEDLEKEYGLETGSVWVPNLFVCGSVLEGVGVIEYLLEPMTLAVYDIDSRREAQIPILPLDFAL